jgi:hypothetical protein
MRSGPSLFEIVAVSAPILWLFYRLALGHHRAALQGRALPMGRGCGGYGCMSVIAVITVGALLHWWG